jgi:hypothetical protein
MHGKDQFHFAEKGKGQFLVFGIVCMDFDFLFEFSAAIASGVSLDFYRSLAAGKDLFRIRNSRAASAGLYFFNVKRCRSFVLNFKAMMDLGAFRYRFELILNLRQNGNGLARVRRRTGP